MDTVHPLVSVAYSFIVNECGELPPDKQTRVIALLAVCVTGDPSLYCIILQQIHAFVDQSNSPLLRLYSTVTVPARPIPDNEARNAVNTRGRQLNFWPVIEDNRLFAGIHRFGLRSWGQVAEFVGNGRSSAQCSQRWSRNLNPQLKKTEWSVVEKQMLTEMAAKWGPRDGDKLLEELEQEVTLNVGIIGFRCSVDLNGIWRRTKELRIPPRISLCAKKSTRRKQIQLPFGIEPSQM
jgi:hypothetical protein